MQRDMLRERMRHALKSKDWRFARMCTEEEEEEGVPRGFFFFSRGGRACVPLSLV